MKSYPVSDCLRYTDSDMRYYYNYLDRFYLLNYQMRKKYGIKTLQFKIPKTLIFKSDNKNIGIDFFEDQ